MFTKDGQGVEQYLRTNNSCHHPRSGGALSDEGQDHVRDAVCPGQALRERTRIVKASTLPLPFLLRLPPAPHRSQRPTEPIQAVPKHHEGTKNVGEG